MICARWRLESLQRAAFALILESTLICLDWRLKVFIFLLPLSAYWNLLLKPIEDLVFCV
jgi:hypothetical protein